MFNITFSRKQIEDDVSDDIVITIQSSSIWLTIDIDEHTFSLSLAALSRSRPRAFNVLGKGDEYAEVLMLPVREDAVSVEINYIMPVSLYAADTFTLSSLRELVY